MKNFINGFLLSFQFFTSIPVRKSLPMDQKSLTVMFSVMPIISFLMGTSIFLILYLNELYFQFTPLFLAIIIVVANIVMTGGLHLDGWIDLCDGYFSYRDQEKRLEILSDSRVGAFGAIGLVVMLLLKIAFFYEILTQQRESYIFFFLVIPILCRMAMMIYFNVTNNVKDTGLAAYFKKNVDVKLLWMNILLYLIIFIGVCLLLKNFILLFLLFCMIALTFLYRKWTRKHFGGMTGDLLGALYEGMELMLWAILLLFI